MGSPPPRGAQGIAREPPRRLPASSAPPRRMGRGARALAVRRALPDRLLRDGARRDAVPAGGLAALRRRRARRGRRLAAAAAGTRGAARRRRGRGRRPQLRDREARRPRGLHERALAPAEPPAPDPDTGLLRTPRRQDDLPGAL